MKHQRGFTLVELMMAIALILLGIIAAVSAMSAGLTADNSIDGQVTALKLAQEEIETIKNTAYANISNVISGYTSYAPLAAPFSNYSMQVVEQTLAQNPSSGELAQITVNIKWNFKASATTISLVTLIANTSAPMAT